MVRDSFTYSQAATPEQSDVMELAFPFNRPRVKLPKENPAVCSRGIDWKQRRADPTRLGSFEKCAFISPFLLSGNTMWRREQ